MAVRVAAGRLAGCRAEEVELRETHISWLFLAGDRAFKLKKPVRLAFVDYTDPERRRFMCAEEVRLNRRLTRGLYLGVRSLVPASDGLRIGGADDPEAIDYVVEMRRYDEARTLEAALERAEPLQETAASLGTMLARFHAGCPRGAGGRARTQRQISVNLDELLEQLPASSARSPVHAVGRQLEAYLRRRGDLLDERAAAGLVREGHGDLRAAHVLLAPQLSVVDCVEFDRALRTLDVAEDLAFLIMDLHRLGAADQARLLVDGYRVAGGDPGPPALLAFFAGHRALIRAKVARITPAGTGPEAEAGEHGRFATFIALAGSMAWRSYGPLVVAICGVAASGKTALARELQATAGLPGLSSDRVRKELGGLDARARGTEALYTDAVSLRTYTELGRRARETVTREGVVVVDATFRRPGDRTAFSRALGDRAPILFVQCVASPETIRRRASARELANTDVSDATAAVAERQLRSWLPLHEVPIDRRLELNTERPLSESVDAVREWLNGRS